MAFRANGFFHGSVNDPVNVVSSFWQNNSCSPFFGPNGTCVLGQLASYAIDVENKDDAIAGIQFAEANNIRLTIKNTGHDYLGRSTGAASLALWTRNLKEMDFFHYSGPDYTGPAVRVGAGATGSELLEGASARGYRVVTGSCSTVGIAGGFTQGGGHSVIGAKYGLAADQVLEWEVVTATGQHLTVSPESRDADLYWALSGGGPANYAVVLSMTVKAYPDGPVAGGSFAFENTDDEVFWDAVSAWLKYTLVLDAVPGLGSGWSISAQGFQLIYAILPDAAAAEVEDLLAPIIADVGALNVSVVAGTTTVHPTFAESYNHFLPQAYSTNNTLGGRLIPRSLVEQETPSLVAAMRAVANSNIPWQINGIAANVTHLRVGNKPASNAVLPAWRDSLYQMNLGTGWQADAGWDTMRAAEERLNEWQAMFRDITPGGGTYMNEATFDNPHWKEDYFGANYDRLLTIKRKYDPKNLLWANAAVGSDESWKPAADGRLCRAQKEPRP
ncbi:fad fmn-containing isoamyl alcohol oxidase protein [Apiospora marii]|uniref:Fad fmn-containing isoamyl alcohol oxidase protein n=1 Tax=Apiospora marii TaxID=335849 RepID=A0ABR1R2M7_9PEZI